MVEPETERSEDYCMVIDVSAIWHTCYVTTFWLDKGTHVCALRTTCQVVCWSECRATHAYTLATALTLPRRRGLPRELPRESPLKLVRVAWLPRAT